MPRNKSTSIKITVHYEGHTTRIVVFDEVSGNRATEEINRHVGNDAELDIIKKRLVYKVKRMPYDEKARNGRCKAVLPKLATA